MAGSKTDSMETSVLNTARGTSLTSWSPFVGLLTAISNGETATVTEVTGGSYARQAVTFGAPSAGSMSNSADITFPSPTVAWGTVVGFIVTDASTAGTARYYGDLTQNEAINIGNTVKILTGNLTVTEG